MHLTHLFNLTIPSVILNTGHDSYLNLFVYKIYVHKLERQHKFIFMVEYNYY